MENSFLYYHVVEKPRIITKKGKFLNNNEITKSLLTTGFGWRLRPWALAAPWSKGLPPPLTKCGFKVAELGHPRPWVANLTARARTWAANPLETVGKVQGGQACYLKNIY